ncbi:MAG: hypothetical protein AB8B78_02125 [Polaribacter sp.]
MFLVFELVLVLFVCSLFIGCSDNENDLEYNLPYFQFINEDTPNLLNLPELDSRLTFANQNNEELYFDVVKSESGRQLHSTGSFVVGSTKHFYFDGQQINLRSTLLDADYSFRFLQISVKRWPKEFNDGRAGIKFKKLSKESHLITNIGRYGPFNNGNQHAFIRYENSIKMDFNNKNYIRVIKIDLTDTEIRYDDWPLPTLDYMYFDINEGIIGFDDRNGNEWRLN